MKIVIAGNYQQYIQYIREHNLTPQEAKYISFPDQLLGIYDAEIIMTGEYWLNLASMDPYLDVIGTVKIHREHRRSHVRCNTSRRERPLRLSEANGRTDC